jgi:hypothetical protein
MKREGVRRCTIQYDGTDFRGYQAQGLCLGPLIGPGIRNMHQDERPPDGIEAIRTVQAEIERAIHRLYGKGLPDPWKKFDFQVISACSVLVTRHATTCPAMLSCPPFCGVLVSIFQPFVSLPKPSAGTRREV